MTEILAAETATLLAPQRPKRRQRWRFLRSRKAVIGACIVAFFVILAVVGPMLAPFAPSAPSDAKLAPPSWEHLLGTTHTGQDLLSQMLYGTQISMVIGVTSAVAATILAVMIGLASGFVGSIADESLSMATNIFLVIPALPLVVIISAYTRDAGAFAIIFVIAITSWAWGARVLRVQTLSLRKRGFVEAARATGEPTWRIIWRDVVPNQLPVITTIFLNTVIGSILVQTSLAFLGLGNLSEYSWGSILYWAQYNNALLAGAWWWFIPPGLAIALVGMGLALLNFGIDEFINPRLRVEHVDRSVVAVESAPVILPPVEEGDDVILRVANLRVEYGSATNSIAAANDVSFTLRRGQVFGLAGESGSGKSTLAYAVTRLHRGAASITGGSIVYRDRDGREVDLLSLSDEEFRAYRWDDLSIVFQSAMSALNPVATIGSQIEDVLTTHRPQMSAADRAKRIAELLTNVGLAADRASAYPHELSGGMRQRAMIAISLALDPEIVVMDEPTTALDVVIQRQIVDLLISLKDSLGFSVIFITHDLSLLVELSDRIAIMYAGRIVEVADAEEFYRSPRHPYSTGLLGSFPNLEGEKRPLRGIAGSPPDLRLLPTGCAFRPRCDKAIAACAVTVPLLSENEGPTGAAKVACHLYTPASAGHPDSGALREMTSR